MSEHSCIHEADIARLANSVERIEKEIFGNGQAGLSKTVPVLAENVKKLGDTNEELRKGVSALLKFQAECVGMEKQRLSTQQKTKIFISAIIGVAGILVSLILKLL
jgi:hypothetical protein